MFLGIFSGIVIEEEEKEEVVGLVWDIFFNFLLYFKFCLN